MSEYQHYEWQTVDRLLTESEQEAVGRLSSHIEVSSIRAVVTYSWGDFKHDPRQVLARFFDAHFYVATRKKHEADMNALASREAETWQQVASLVDLKQTKSYDEAVKLLARLRQLAAFRGSKDDYQRQVSDLCERYRRLSGFKWRVQQAKLLDASRHEQEQENRHDT